MMVTNIIGCLLQSLVDKNQIFINYLTLPNMTLGQTSTGFT